MKGSAGIVPALFFMIFFPSLLFSRTASWLKVSGQKIVNERGEEVFLAGFNLGNWLLVEPWMLKLSGLDGIQAGRDIFDLFEKRFGPEKGREIYFTHADNYITEEDIRYLAGLGVNFVRVPFWYRALFDAKYARKELHYLDQAVNWCRKHGVYVLIDMHSAPGGQSSDTGILGERLKNQLWTSEENIRETIRMWQTIARKYRDDPVVAGYDLLNEATGAPSYETLMKVYDRIYRAIREIDTKHIIFIEDALKGIYRMPPPRDMGWENVVYSFHFYPGFGGPDNMEEIIAASQVTLPSLKAASDYLQVPFHAGEFNSMTISKGGIEYLRRYMQIFREYGWSWNIWSYKRIDDNDEDRWGLAGKVADWQVPDLNKMSFEEAKAFFRNFNFRTAGKNAAYEAMIRDFFLESRNFRRKEYLTKEKIVLAPQNGHMIRSAFNSGIRVEWNRKKINFGFWNRDDSVLWKIEISRENAGIYRMTLDYATDSPEARLNLILDHYLHKKIALPRTRGGWEGYTPSVEGYIRLSEGVHFLKLTGVSPDAGVMNLRSVLLERVSSAPALLEASPEAEIVLSPFEARRMNRKKSLCVEWQNNPPNFGCMSGWESVEWEIDSLREADYDLGFLFSTPHSGIMFEIYWNEELFKTIKVPSTGGWHDYSVIRPGTVRMKKGKNGVRFVILSGFDENSGNLRSVRLKKK